MKVGKQLSRAESVYRGYVLATLTFVFGLNYADRFLMTLLLEPIKRDLGLSDTQLGFLTGIAFALFYATLGLPIARWADRGNRVNITALAIGLWGATVTACLGAVNFTQLALIRVFAGIGESGCMPPTYSLVGDYYPRPAERTRAMTLYWLAAPVAALLSFLLGGWLNQIVGWRMTFFAVGIPGLLAAVVVRLTVLDPRSLRPGQNSRQRSSPRMAKVLDVLWHQRSARNVSLAVILLFTVGHGLTPWYAAFMMRSHGMTTAELAIWLGFIFSIAGIGGTLLGGFVSARWFGDNEAGQMRLSAVAIAACFPCFALFLLMPHKQQALAALVPLVMAFNFFVGPTFALMQRLVVSEMRATTLAVVMLFANLIGMGLGPQVVGIFSDLLGPILGSDSLRYSMLVVSLVTFWSAYHFWQVGLTVKDDLMSVASEVSYETFEAVPSSKCGI